MSDNPFRHILFLSILLFIVLSSGSLQIALNCHERDLYSTPSLQATDCHPVPHVKALYKTVADECHSCHPSKHANNDSALQNIESNQTLAMSNSRWETPAYRCAEPVPRPAATDCYDSQLLAFNLPLSQNLKELRSTILIM